MERSLDPQAEPSLPKEPVHRFLKPLSRFLHVEASSGIVLLLCAVIALVAANSGVADQYLGFWKMHVGLTIGDFTLDHSLKHWINDGLMAIFFFVIGLEVKREIVMGELQDFRRAALPLVAALGGMVVPAGIFIAMQAGSPGQRGWGVPMATDIAFVVGCMAVLGRRVPAALRIILLSLAIVDDIGAIFVIAFGYTETIHWSWLILGLIGIGVVVLLQRLGVRSIGMYTLVGVLIWLGFHESGIHATIAGVALGLLTPARAYLERGIGGTLMHMASDVVHGEDWEADSHRAKTVSKYRWLSRETISPLEYLIYVLHPWVAFVIMPLFALANAGVVLSLADIASSVSVAVIAGLVIGKPVGILLCSWVAVKLGIARLPADITWRHLAGGGFLAGIGFTMALFITSLAFADADLLRATKVGVLVGSLISAVVGMVILATAPVNNEEKLSTGMESANV
ncbi:Na+/H+ antiporter NhaA [Rubinisphaera margarita]|uniref:Na+/H+ antiporter NhaA n=1 Tax=Rubinisphaera margarita TaxID=2909586 RepID=UPI001EE8E559|nr:Na+/H+ antiporter NhaA [Rubinisphaera margarita]MCG6156919.1 Na+/H+ antiporter NhaA [Rubinisphaera margarita]